MFLLRHSQPLELMTGDSVPTYQFSPVFDLIYSLQWKYYFGRNGCFFFVSCRVTGKWDESLERPENPRLLPYSCGVFLRSLYLC